MLTIDVRGIDEAIRQLENWARLDKRTLMQIAGETASRQLRRRIASEKRAPDGRPWAPLRESTVARKGSQVIMIHRGRLLQSVAHSASNDQVVIGLNVPYAQWQHTGTKKNSMPARPAVGFSRENEGELERVMASFVRRQLGI